MYTEECIQTFLEKQEQLFDEPVAETYEEAEEFLEDCMAVVADSIDEVRKYLSGMGADVDGMSNEELEEASEVFALPDGKYLITRRVLTKAWAPGWWEVSGGAAQAGESSYDAVLREVKEETGLDVSGAQGGYLFTYKRENPGEGDNYFVDVYRFVMDVKEEDLHLQEEETDGHMFATLNQIKEFAAQGKFLHYDSIQAAFENL